MTFDLTKAPDRHADSQRWRERALARWEGEGGAGPTGPDSSSGYREPKAGSPPLTNAELVQLRVRVIALENLVIALLARTDEQQLEGIRQMAAYISPRHGFTAHRLTIHAAAEMISLVDRADQFRGAQPPATLLSLADALEVQHGPAAALPSST